MCTRRAGCGSVRGYVTKSAKSYTNFHVHPQKFLQRVVFSDGSQVEWTCLASSQSLITLMQDSTTHPSWNPSKLTRQRLILDSFGSVAKFHRKFFSSKEQDPQKQDGPESGDYKPSHSDANPENVPVRESESAADKWRSMEDSWSSINIEQHSNRKGGRLEMEALKDPEEEKRLAAIAAASAQLQKKKKPSK